MMFFGRFVLVVSPTSSITTSCSVALSGTEYVMSRSMHSSTAYLGRSEEHTSELQSLAYLVCRLLLEKKKKKKHHEHSAIYTKAEKLAAPTQFSTHRG